MAKGNKNKTPETQVRPECGSTLCNQPGKECIEGSWFCSQECYGEAVNQSTPANRKRKSDQRTPPPTFNEMKRSELILKLSEAYDEIQKLKERYSDIEKQFADLCLQMH